LKVTAIITAAGSGLRFGEEKQFKLLCGKPLFLYSLDCFIQSPLVNEIILVVPKSSFSLASSITGESKRYNKVKMISGGEKRQDSVRNAVMLSEKNSDLICIHDAARPFVSSKLIELSIKACNNADGAIIAVRSVDTIKYSNNDYIEKTLCRNNIWLAQTPQVFDRNKLIGIYEKLDVSKLDATDESSLMEKMGYKIRLINNSSVSNFKITTNNDWKLAESIVR